MRAVAGRESFPIGTKRNVSRQLFEQTALEIFEACEQRRSDEARRDTHQYAVPQIAANDAQLKPRGLREQGTCDPRLAKLCYSFEQTSDAR